MKAKLVGLLFVLFGTLTSLYSSYDVGPTPDEVVYQREGTVLLRGWPIDARFEPIHPPFSKWWGALGDRLLPAQLTSDADLRAAPALRFRLMHVVLYALVCTALVLTVGGFGGPWAALFTGLFFGLCPNLKAMASLHVTDADSSLLNVLAFCLLLFSAGRRTGIAILAGVALTLAVGAKVSVAFFWPFFALLAYSLSRKSRADRWRKAKWWFAIALGMLIGVLIAFRLQLSGLIGLRGNIDELIGYNSESHLHLNSLLDHRWDRGVWFYYLVLGFFKIPILQMGAIGFAVYWAIRHWRINRDLWFFLFSPALAFVVTLSLISQVQIGFRHVLPALLLGYVGVAWVLARALEARFRRFSWSLGLLIILALIVDLTILREGSYLTYASPLTPPPVTRMMADSNLDWGQGLPRHLKARYPEYYRMRDADVVDALINPPVGGRWFGIGASEISGLWSQAAPAFKIFDPAFTVAGTEFHQLGREGLWRLARLWLSSEYDSTLSTSAMRAIGPPVSDCPLGKVSRVFVREPIPSLDHPHAGLELREGIEYYFLAAPDGQIEITLGPGQYRAKRLGSMLKVSGSGPVEMELIERPNPASRAPRVLGFRMAMVWQECE